MPTLIDLHHTGLERVIAAYLLEGEEPAVVDGGPATCVDTLEAGLRRAGLEPADLRHLILTHIHLDHAGAAGTLVRRYPELQVHASEVGAPHLVDPSRLEQSARRLYGDDFDLLFGVLLPVPEDNLQVLGDRVLGLEAFPTPGHARHHISCLAPDGICYAGDATGVRIGSTPFLAPASPPPEVDLEAWERTLAEIETRRPAGLALTHFGLFSDPGEHLALMRERLALWSERVRAGATEDEFLAAAEADLRREVDAATAEAYRRAGAAWLSYLGLRRYWDKKAAASS